jgi:hypothetical protein
MAGTGAVGDADGEDVVVAEYDGEADTLGIFDEGSQSPDVFFAQLVTGIKSRKRVGGLP